MAVSNKFPMYETLTFIDVFESADDFYEEYTDNGIPTIISETNCKTLYYLLYAKYGNSPIANRDVNQFKYKCWSIIYKSGPTWEKRLSIQASLRGLSESEIMVGAKAISNHANNPSSDPTTANLEELTYINDQNTNTVKKGVLDAYAQLWQMLKFDVTEDFLEEFKYLFKVFVTPENPLLYVTSDEDEEEEE